MDGSAHGRPPQAAEGEGGGSGAVTRTARTRTGGRLPDPGARRTGTEMIRWTPTSFTRNLDSSREAADHVAAPRRVAGPPLIALAY
ncbi:hypothetical protein GCM10027187_38870 [Streptosporangium sandarakinum]